MLQYKLVMQNERQRVRYVCQLQTVVTGLTFEGSEICRKTSYLLIHFVESYFHTTVSDYFVCISIVLPVVRFRRWTETQLEMILTPQGNFLQLVLVAVAEWWIWIKICNLKDGGYRDKDMGVWKRRGDINIIRASSFAHKPKLSSHHYPQKLPLVHSHTH